MDDATVQPVQDIPVEDFTAQVEAKKGLVIGLGTGAAITGLVGLVMGNWILAVIVGVTLGYIFWRNTKP